MTPSISGKGQCWDNAPMESFFHTLKTEHVYLEDFILPLLVKSILSLRKLSA